VLKKSGSKVVDIAEILTEYCSHTFLDTLLAYNVNIIYAQYTPKKLCIL